MIRVTAPARLHFGLFHPAPDDEPPRPWPDRDGRPTLPARRFGGVGLMIESPTLQLRVEAAETWSAEGPSAERALAFARRFAATASEFARPQRLVVESALSEHAGLGSGTRLGLAVARALATAWEMPDAGTPELACRVGRGLRSSIGVHGFERGGFLVDGGKGENDAVAPLLLRRDFPDHWRVLLLRQSGERGIHGMCERKSFQKMSAKPADLRRTDALCRLVLLGLLPALDAADLDAFGEALFDFNVRAGEPFAASQGGVYASPAVTHAIAFLRELGVRGAGQSSWGPTVFAVTDAARADSLIGPLRQRFPGWSVTATAACNRGARVTRARPDAPNTP